jgi:hypothetical protein
MFYNLLLYSDTTYTLFFSSLLNIGAAVRIHNSKIKYLFLLIEKVQTATEEYNGIHPEMEF